MIKSGTPANIINHVGLVLDISPSMNANLAALVKVANNFVSQLAARSTELDQETRVTIYVFSDPELIECRVFDKDALRLPALGSLHYTGRSTALIDATLKSITDLEKTAQMYGDHAFLVYVLTDGQENSSRTPNKAHAISAKLNSLPENWTVGLFVPNQHGVFEAKRFGFPADNISVWNPSEQGIKEFGEIVTRTTNDYMTGRSMGIRGSRSLFKLNTLTVTDIRNMTPVPAYSYRMLYVPFDQRVDDFVRAMTGKPLVIGTAYYQLMKKETIQPQKSIAISYNNKIYSGPEARQLLGLPDTSVEVKPDAHPGYTIFVQSTAPNRKLMSGTNLLLMDQVKWPYS